MSEPWLVMDLGQHMQNTFVHIEASEEVAVAELDQETEAAVDKVAEEERPAARGRRCAGASLSRSASVGTLSSASSLISTELEQPEAEAGSDAFPQYEIFTDEDEGASEYGGQRLRLRPQPLPALTSMPRHHCPREQQQKPEDPLGDLMDMFAEKEPQAAVEVPCDQTQDKIGEPAGFAVPTLPAKRLLRLLLGPALLGVLLAVAGSGPSSPGLPAGGLATEDTSPGAIMARHSENFLQQIKGMDAATLAVLQDKLQLQQMQINMDTQVFSTTRETAKDIIRATCSLPASVCSGMLAAVHTTEMKYYKKSSVPLDSNQGSYFAVWMWVQEGSHDGIIQVAFKAASLSYQLRDVVTYRDQVEDEPVIQCETQTQTYMKLHETKQERCREVSRRKIVNPMPVFKQAIMNPREMQLVDTLMESMLAKKALENSDGADPRAPGGGASQPADERALERGR